MSIFRLKQTLTCPMGKKCHELLELKCISIKLLLAIERYGSCFLHYVKNVGS